MHCSFFGCTVWRGLTVAILIGRNDEIFLHENISYFPEENNSIVLPYKMAATVDIYFL
jgi:hypothetical protein